MPSLVGSEMCIRDRQDVEQTTLSLKLSDDSLNLLEILELLILVVLNDVGISVVGEISFPSEESGVVVGDSSQSNGVKDGGGGDGRRGLNNLVGDVMVEVREFKNLDTPRGGVLKADLEDGVNLSS
eukprot:TRINITY_DN1122_c0_g1_i22.p1 TRINITY_DN1122_c0_g1~~TRINITY_DN1122_c0_g1_i22.p1  ORF type:complete len:126 (+),score=29.00 TRINITY_DN1122_c0_g1_i22:101-478(+)